MKRFKIKQPFLLFFFFLLTIGLALGYGEYGAGTYGEGKYGFGTPEPATTTTTVTSSSGGGGGRAIDGFSKGIITKTINYADAFIFSSKGYKHTLVILKVNPDSIKIKISSNPIELTLKVGETKEVDTDGNNLNDFSIKLNSITKYGGEFTFTILDEIKLIEEEPKAEVPIEIPTEPIEIVEIPVEEIVPTSELPKQEAKQKSNYLPIILILVIVVLGVALMGIYYYNKKNQKEKDGKQKT